LKITDERLCNFRETLTEIIDFKNGVMPSDFGEYRSPKRDADQQSRKKKTMDINVSEICHTFSSFETHKRQNNTVL
jgi:hypothetical protein